MLKTDYQKRDTATRFAFKANSFLHDNPIQLHRTHEWQNLTPNSQRSVPSLQLLAVRSDGAALFFRT